MYAIGPRLPRPLAAKILKPAKTPKHASPADLINFKCVHPVHPKASSLHSRPERGLGVFAAKAAALPTEAIQVEVRHPLRASGCQCLSLCNFAGQTTVYSHPQG